MNEEQLEKNNEVNDGNDSFPRPANEREKVRQRTLEQLQKQHVEIKELRVENSFLRMKMSEMETEIKSLHGQVETLKAALKTVL